MVARPATRPSAGVLAIRSSLGAPTALRGNGQRTVFDEAAGINQLGDVLSGGAAPLLVPLGNRSLATLVKGEQVPLPDLVEVGAWPVEIDGSDRGLAGGSGAGAGEDHQRIPGSDDLARRHEIADRSQCVRCDEDVLHFHRLEHDQLAAGAELDTNGGDLDHGAGQLRTQHFLTREELEHRNTRVVLTRQRRGRQLRKLLVDESGRHPNPTGLRCRTAALAEN